MSDRKSKALLKAFRRTMDERDRRYTDNRTCDQDAVKLAKSAADEAKGKVSTATILAVIGCLLSTAALVIGAAALVIK